MVSVLTPAEILIATARTPGLLTWCEIWCDVENSKSFRSSRDRRIFPGHRLKGASALHNFLASIFTAPSETTWSDMPGSTRKNQVTGLVTLRHRSIMSGALDTSPAAMKQQLTASFHDFAVSLLDEVTCQRSHKGVPCADVHVEGADTHSYGRSDMDT
jgi:hypothetical protein